MQENKGKFFIIDGNNQGEENIQLRKLENWLTFEGYKMKIAEFDQYHHKSISLTEEYLTKKHNNNDLLNCYQSAALHALDRLESSLKIKQWLREGYVVLANRYITSNMAIQALKIDDKQKRKTFYRWVYELELRFFDFPKPDKIFFIQTKTNSQIFQKINFDKIYSLEKIYKEIASEYQEIEIINPLKKENLFTSDAITYLLREKINPFLKPKFYNDYKPEEPHQIYQNDYNKIENIGAADYYTLKPYEKVKIVAYNKFPITNSEIGIVHDDYGSFMAIINNNTNKFFVLNYTNHQAGEIHIKPGDPVGRLAIVNIK